MKQRTIVMDKALYEDLTKDQIKNMIEYRQDRLTIKQDNLKCYINDRELLEYYVNHEHGIFSFINEASLKYKKGKEEDTIELLLKFGEKEIKFKFTAFEGIFNKIIGAGIKEILLMLIGRVSETEYDIAKYEKEIAFLQTKEPVDTPLFETEDA